MKHFCAAILFSITTQVVAQTSVYHPMPDSNATWCEWAAWYIPPTYFIEERNVLRISGDTMMGALQYHKIAATGYQYCCASSVYYTDAYRGAYRQDTALRRVYWMAPNDTIEVLLYDFTLAVGDTTPAIINPGMIITQIDSVQVGSDFRKRWRGYYFATGDSAFIVEGVGSSFGLYRLNWKSVEYSSVLNVFEWNTVTFVIDSSMTCPFVAGVEESAGNEPSLEIYPNPSHGIFTVEYSNESTIDAQLQISDITGRLILSQSFEGTTGFTWSCYELLDNGIYFVNVVTDVEILTRRIIIQH